MSQLLDGPITRRTVVVGGAGFIGSHVVDHLLALPKTERVTVFDNGSSGRSWHLDAASRDPRFTSIRGDAKDTAALAEAFSGHDLVVHLASNPDIARAATEPTIDFDEGTLLTSCVVEAMRVAGVRRILYASGSGVYGDLGEEVAHEDRGPLVPVSTYAASKLAGEALIAAYCAMFDLVGSAFRFGNVVGPRQTHGVGFDFLRALLADPARLRILGDGRQSKSYVHVDDVIQAVMRVAERDRAGFGVYNVATGDYITVVEIAELAVAAAGLPRGSVRFEFTGGSRGWPGDVPIVRLDTTRIRRTGWRCGRSSAQALDAALRSMVSDARAGRLTASAGTVAAVGED